MSRERERSARGAHGGRAPAGALAGLLLLAALVRLGTLSHQSFWLDEGYTERLIHMSLGSMLREIPRTESTPPLYYLLAWAWARAFGFGEFGLRSLSALAGIATVALAYALGFKLAGRRAAALTGLLVSVSPLLVWFSQEARAYALATLLGTLSLLCLIGYREGGRGRGRGRWLGGWAVSAALGLATHYFVAFLVAAELVWLVAGARRPRAPSAPAPGTRELALACVFVVAVAGALVPLALAQRGTGHADYIASGALSTRVAQVPKQFLIGYASPGQKLTGPLAALLALIGVVLVMPGVRARGRATPLVVTLSCALACVLAPIVLALVGVDFLDTRNLLPALPALLAVLGAGFAAPRVRPAAALPAAAFALLLLAVVGLVDTHPRYQRDDWRGAAHALGSPVRTRAIVVSPGSGLIPLGVYQPALHPLGGTATVSELDLVAIPGQLTGGGVGTPPRLPAGAVAPPGFRLAARDDAQTFTALRYLATRPVPVSAARAGAFHLGRGSYLVLAQPAR